MSDSTQLTDQFLYQCSLKPDPVIKISKNKRLINVVDGNNGSYSSGQITIDATNQLNGSSGFGSLRDGYLILPYVATLQNTGGGALAGPAHRFCIAPKCNIANVIDSMSVELNGKEIITMQDYKLFWNNLRAQTEWTTTTIDTHGADAYMYPDDWSSTAFSANASTAGDGYVNNGTHTAAVLGTTATGSALSLNEGFTKRLLAGPPPVGANTYGWPTLSATSSATIAQQHGRGAFVAGSASAGAVAGTWYYMLKIRLVDLHPIFHELDLLANPQLKLTLKVNTGYCDVDVAATTKAMSLKSTVQFGNVCPLMISSATANNAMESVLGTAATTLRLAFGPILNSITPLATSGNFFPFTTSRLYIPFYDLENPSAIVSKPLKTCRYLDVYAQYFKQRTGLGVQTQQFNTAFNFQLSASLKNVKYLALIPFAETSAGHFLTANGVEQFQSPFDSAPWTCQAGASVRSFQVQIGNQNVFARSHDYDFESFLDEYSKLSSINGDQTRELSNGLIDIQKWSTAQRVMIADCSRITNRDVPASIQVSGTNASCQGMNALILVVYERELEVDRLTGEVNRTD